jgi:hypothetical protein
VGSKDKHMLSMCHDKLSKIYHAQRAYHKELEDLNVFVKNQCMTDTHKAPQHKK